MKKRVMALLLTGVMIFTSGAGAAAADMGMKASEQAEARTLRLAPGEKREWTWKGITVSLQDGVLTARGKGFLENFVENLDDGWWAFSQEIKKIVISPGITGIDDWAFSYLPNATELMLPEGLKTIGQNAFWRCESLGTVVIPSTVVSLERNAFAECPGVKLVLPDSLVSVEDGSSRKLGVVKVTGSFHYKEAFEVLDAVNKERKKRGLFALRMDQDLLEAGMQRAAETGIYFSHTRPSGLDCFTAEEKMRGENIASGLSSAEATVAQWMNSPGHRANILGESYRSIGVGCYEQDGIWYWVQVFGGENIRGASKSEKTVKRTVEIAVDPSVYRHSFVMSEERGRGTKCNVGESIQLRVWMGDPDWAWMGSGAVLSTEGFRWSSSNSRVAQVNQKGRVAAVGKGTAVITATTLRGEPMQVSITVKVDDKSFKVKVVGGDQTYTGKQLKPSVKVYAKGKKLKASQYQISYKKNKNVGTATVTVKGKGKYRDYKGTATFRIKMGKIRLSGVSAPKKKQITVKWKRNTQADGYEIQISTDKKFKKNVLKKAASGAKASVKFKSGIKARKNYYVRMRGYKVVEGKRWYGSWSDKEKVKTR